MTEMEEVKAESGIWLPEKKGDKLEGHISEIRESQYGGRQVTIETKDGNKITTPSHRALQSRLGGFKVSDYICITFQGEELPRVKGQKGTRLYSVWREKPMRAFEEVVN